MLDAVLDQLGEPEPNDHLQTIAIELIKIGFASCAEHQRAAYRNILFEHHYAQMFLQQLATGVELEKVASLHP